MLTLNATAFTMLEGLFEMDRDGSNAVNFAKVVLDNDVFSSANYAHRVLKKEGLIVEGADGVRITEKGRAEYIRLRAERDAKSG